MAENNEQRRVQRVHFRLRVIVEGMTVDGASFQVETVTTDLSPLGAAIVMPYMVPAGTVVSIEATLKASEPPFRTEAVVRNSRVHHGVAGVVVGVEYTGDPIPVVSWH